MSNTKEGTPMIHTRTGDNFYYFDDLYPSHQHHENERSPLSYWLQQAEEERMEKERLEKALKEESDRKKKALHANVDQIVEDWRNENNPDLTRVILKIVNNTDHIFQLTKTNRPLTKAQIDTVRIPPQEPIALIIKSEYFGLDDGKSVRTTHQFGHYLDFDSNTAGFKFIFGLAVEGDYNSQQGHWKVPHRSHYISSTGTTPIKCTSTVTAASKRQPFNFEILIVLG